MHPTTVFLSFHTAYSLPDHCRSVRKSRAISTVRGSWRRIIIEKPFGHDLASATDLNNQVHKVFEESQVYRIDHYLGKETVQNLLVFRFANAIFEPLWNRNYIDHVQITVSEEVGLGNRAGYYDTAGIMRDVFQNHLLQLLTLTTMEPPAEFNDNALRDEKVKVLKSIRPIRTEDVAQYTVRAQYRTYRDEKESLQVQRQRHLPFSNYLLITGDGEMYLLSPLWQSPG